MDSCLTYKDQTRVEMSEALKHSSLLRQSILALQNYLIFVHWCQNIWANSTAPHDFGIIMTNITLN